MANRADACKTWGKRKRKMNFGRSEGEMSSRSVKFVKVLARSLVKPGVWPFPFPGRKGLEREVLFLPCKVQGGMVLGIVITVVNHQWLFLLPALSIA